MRALGLDGIEVRVEDILASRELVAGSSLVLEHADTYRGRGDLRPLVRHWIEAWGGRLAGAPAAAAQASDDKILAQARLAAAGLRVPRSRVIARGASLDVDGLRFPLVLKRPFEHGSRGVLRIAGPKALREASARWLARGDGALLAEELVEGRELAVAVLEERGRPRALPAVEALLGAGSLYTARLKGSAGPLPIAPARLEPAEARRVARAALRAFRALELRDYARFDLRLEPDGTPYLLEANARPSVEDGTELRLAAELAGMSFPELLARVLENAAVRHGDAALARRLREARRRLA
ncbi:MAG: ATP-grasp domain-containing protein [Planctomycetes bacterium]|nr:ATP-grasp domain-containing protein [Planctomycetota bacterium]